MTVCIGAKIQDISGNADTVMSLSCMNVERLADIPRLSRICWLAYVFMRWVKATITDLSTCRPLLYTSGFGKACLMMSGRHWL